MRLTFFLGVAKDLGVRMAGLLYGIRNPTLRMESGVRLKGDLRRLVVGEGVALQSGTIIHAGGMSWCQGLGRVTIGDGTTISPNCVIYGAGPGGVTIGKRLDCGPFVGIYSSRTDHVRGAGHVFAPVIIGDDVIIFSHAVISPGVRIGDRAVIASGSTVLSDVPAGALVAGTPARVVRRGLKAKE